MSKKALAALLLLGAAGAAFAARSRIAAPAAAEPEGERTIFYYVPDFSLSDFELPTFETNAEHNMNSNQSQANVAAILRTIISAEGTALGGRDPYATVYAYAFTISNFSDHPGNLGWKGVKLSDRMCSLAGFGPGCVSTAAGAFQITKTTWNRLKKKVHLPDFTQGSQDRAALALIEERGALADLYAGRFATVINKCRKEWASLPGAGYGQGEKSLASLQAAYIAAGGAIA